MRILHVSKFYTPIVGGIETVVQNLAEGLEKKGFQNEVLVCQKRWKTSVDEINGVRIFRAGIIGMAMRTPISFSFFSIFRKRVQGADAVILHHPFPFAFLAYLLYGKKKPCFVWYHSDIVRQRISGFLIRPMIHAVLNRAQKIFVSNNNLIQYSPILQRFKAKCVIIPFGIDASRLEETDLVRHEAQKIRLQYGNPLMLSVGRLVYYKGFEYVIRAMQGIEARLLIIGDGPLKDSLMRLARDLGLQKNIIFIPHIPSLLPYYYACDFFVLPSCEISEAFGIVQIEAMACGKPVINTNLPTGVPEVSIDGETGITVPPRDSRALHEAVLKLIGNQGLRDRLGKNAKKRAEGQFRIGKFIDRIVEEIKLSVLQR